MNETYDVTSLNSTHSLHVETSLSHPSKNDQLNSNRTFNRKQNPTFTGNEWRLISKHSSFTMEPRGT